MLPDATRPKNSNESILEASAIYEAFLENSANGYFVYDRELRVRLWSPVMERITGLSAREVLGRPVSAILPFLGGEGEALFREALAGKSVQARDRAYEVPEAGRSGWFDAEIFPLTAPGAGIVAGGVIVSDITETKRVRAAQVESERRFENMANGSPVMLWMSGTDGLCNFFNQTWLDFSGRTLEQEWGVGWSEMVHPVDFQFCMDTYLEAFNRRAPFEMEYRLRRKDGEFRWILDRGAPRFAPDGAFAGYIGSCVDITERKNLETELKQSVRTRDDFLSIASHELKTPLTSLSLQLGILSHATREGADPQMLVKRVAAVSEVAERQLRRLNELIEDLLDVSRIGTGKLPLNRSETDLVALASGVLESVQAQAKTAGCNLRFVKPSEPIQGVWDPARIEQVLTNLLTNAFKYAAGSEVEVRLDSEGRTAILEVSDKGPGIAEGDQAAIFEKFHRASASKNLGGLGLGLFIIKEIVEKHGGSIRVKSAPGQGAVFTVSLPR